MNTFKKFSKFLLLGALALPLSASAAETTKTSYIVIEQSDNTTTEFALASQPTLSFKADSLVVTCDNDEIVLPLQGTSCHFEERESTPTGINNVPTVTPDNQSTLAFAQGSVNGLKAGAKVSVYTTNGMKVGEFTADNSGRANLELSQLPKGYYIIKTPTRSFKIVNR